MGPVARGEKAGDGGGEGEGRVGARKIEPVRFYELCRQNRPKSRDTSARKMSDFATREIHGIPGSRGRLDFRVFLSRYRDTNRISILSLPILSSIDII